MAELFGLFPWHMADLGLHEYIGLHYYRRARDEESG
jgi:hypothetical protein